MKTLLSLLFILSSILTFGQALDTSNARFINNSNYEKPNAIYPKKGLITPSYGRYANDTSSKIAGQLLNIGAYLYRCNGSYWEMVGGSSTIDTSIFIKKQTEPPTATLTGGETRELMSSGANITYNLTIGFSRQSATPTSSPTASISSVTLNGVPQSFTNPPVSTTAFINASVSVARNTNTTFTVVVTTSDGKTATAGTSVNFSPKRYWGFVSDTSTLRNGSNDAALIGLLNSELSSSKVKDFGTQTPSAGTQFFVYIYKADQGALNQIFFNGTPAIEALNSVTRNFTSSTGFTGSYKIYWNTVGQVLSSTITAQ